jgi:zinc/manganese transport system substrate-binding protein
MRLLALAACVLLGFAGLAAAQPAVRIVAAENFYGDIARQIAGPAADISSIMSNPDQDPHLFEASPSVAKALSGARIVIMNGADYDPWMEKLLASAKSANRQTIVVADLVGKHPGDNPHLWYDTKTIAAAARAIANALASADPAHKDDYETHLHGVIDSLTPIDTKIAAMRTQFAGTPVTATEPVFGYMAAALGLTMRNERFQLAVMNDTEPSASDVAAFETDLRRHRVRVLLYNSQATDSAARRLLGIARKSGIPVVGVTETEPAGKTYQSWMNGQLDALNEALSKPPS